MDGVRYSTLSIESNEPLVGNMNCLEGNPALWFIPEETKVDRTKLTVSLNQAIQSRQLKTLGKPHQEAFHSLSAQTIAHLKENTEVGNLMDHVDDLSEEALRGLGYM